ncbi:cytochrome P450 [Mycena leptocephala]|nr:cytochrome P450 [Mycena leptocephala]
MTPVTIICALLAIFYVVRILRRRLSSTLDNIPGPPPTSFLTGNLTEYHDPDDWEFQRKLEQNYGRVVRFQGLLGARSLFVFIPTAMQSILVKDQNIYEEHKDSIAMSSLVFGPGILSTEGDHHRKFRKIMIPAFSTANLRRMAIASQSSGRLEMVLFNPSFVTAPRRQLDLNNILCRTSLELIGQTGIGYSFDPMLPGKEHTDQYARALKGYSLREIRDLDFMSATALNLVKERKEAIRNVKSNMSSEEGCASPTKSSLLPPHKLRAEILAYPERWIMTRLWDYPISMPLSVKQCDYIRLLPSGNPPTPFCPSHTGHWVGRYNYGHDQRPKGTLCYIAIGASNHDKQVWGEDALEFRPERWVNGKAEQELHWLQILATRDEGRTLRPAARLQVLQPDPRIKWLKGDPIQARTLTTNRGFPSLWNASRFKVHWCEGL